MKRNQGIKLVIGIALFLVITGLIYVYFLMKSDKNTIDFDAQMSDSEVRKALENDLVEITGGQFDYYGLELLSPDDFTEELLSKEKVHANTRYEMNQDKYSTYRLVLPVSPGKNYGIAGQSVTYAEKLWVNGELLLQVGNVSDNAKDFVPKTESTAVFYTPQTDTLEIIIQRANFNHAYRGDFSIVVGPGDKVNKMNHSLFFPVFLQIGLLAAAMILNFALFCTHPKALGGLYIAVACLFSILRISILDPKPIMEIFPNLDWYFGHRLESISIAGTTLFILLYVKEVIPRLVPRKLYYSLVGLCGIYILTYIVLPSTLYTRRREVMFLPFVVMLLIFIGFAVYGVWRDRKKLRNTQYMIMGGATFYGICLMVDVFTHNFAEIQITKLGMILFVLLNVLVVEIELKQAKQDLLEVSGKEKQLEDRNRSLMKIYTFREDIMNSITHEMNTPLTVISGYAKLAANAVRSGGNQEKIIERLELISSEALRLGRLTEQMKTKQNGDDWIKVSERLELQRIFEHAKEFCEIIGERYGNRIETECHGELYISYIQDEIFQVLYNLIVNANRHMKNGVITLIGYKEGEFVRILCVDHGEGMDHETQQRAFEAGFSADGSSGLGLSIVHEIVEGYGGTIELQDTEGGGLTVSFTVPRAADTVEATR